METIVFSDRYTEGLAITRDTENAQVEMFSMSEAESWFAVRLIDVLSQSEDFGIPSEDSPTLDDLLEPESAS